MDYEKKYKEALEKAKAYDEALELMRDCVPDENGLVHVRPSEIFRSLEESLDERIRKALLRFHASTIELDGIKGKDILAWLEKQGQKPAEWSEEDEKVLNTTIAFLDEFKTKGYENAVMCIDWLKLFKQRIGE